MCIRDRCVYARARVRACVCVYLWGVCVPIRCMIRHKRNLDVIFSKSVTIFEYLVYIILCKKYDKYLTNYTKLYTFENYLDMLVAVETP